MTRIPNIRHKRVKQYCGSVWERGELHTFLTLVINEGRLLALYVGFFTTKERAPVT
jgi:hypothetical protein